MLEIAPTKAEHIFTRAKKVLPGGVNSPVRAWHGIGIAPMGVERGEGASIVDVNGPS